MGFGKDGFAKQCHSNSDMEDRGDSQESAADDIHDLLSSDLTTITDCLKDLDYVEYGRDEIGIDIHDVQSFGPFDTDIKSTFTTITGRFEDLDYVEYGRSEIGIDDESYKFCVGLNFFRNNAMGFHEFSGSISFDKSKIVGGFGENCYEMSGDESFHSVFSSSNNMDDILCSENDSLDNNVKEKYKMCTDGDVKAPHPALSFALGYLGIRDLLTVSEVCKSLCDIVHDDPLLWKHVHVDHQLNEKITDDILLKLTNRAHGKLQCLSLTECPRVTDDGLKLVLKSNPELTKLSVPGCIRISIDGIVNALKALKSSEKLKVKHLRISGLYGLTRDHFEELKILLRTGTDKCDKKNVYKPRFYDITNLYLSCDDDRAIDVEMCPKCQNIRQVYDCPSVGCIGNKCSTQSCCACTLCIHRCVQCSRCVKGEYEETFTFDYLCSDCLKQVTKCQNGR